MKQLLRKLFWADFNPQKIICIVPDEITLVNGRQKIKLRKIQSLVRQMNIENNFYKNLEND